MGRVFIDVSTSPKKVTSTSSAVLKTLHVHLCFVRLLCGDLRLAVAMELGNLVPVMYGKCRDASLHHITSHQMYMYMDMTCHDMTYIYMYSYVCIYIYTDVCVYTVSIYVNLWRDNKIWKREDTFSDTPKPSYVYDLHICWSYIPYDIYIYSNRNGVFKQI